MLIEVAELFNKTTKEILKIQKRNRSEIEEWDSLVQIQLYVLCCEILNKEIDFGNFMEIRTMEEILNIDNLIENGDITH